MPEHSAEFLRGRNETIAEIFDAWQCMDQAPFRDYIKTMAFLSLAEAARLRREAYGRRIATLESELAMERARLDFLISIMNGWDMFHACHEAWHPTKRTSQLRATDAEWREFLDAAMKGTV